MAARQIPAYVQKVPAGPRLFFKIGKVKERMKLATQRERTAMDMATPRMALGKISEMSTQATGPRVAAKTATASRARATTYQPVLPL